MVHSAGGCSSLCCDADKLISFIRARCSDSLFCAAPCGHVSKHLPASSSRSAPKKTPASARSEMNAATSELLRKVRGILILMTLDTWGNLRIVIALFNQSKDIKASSNSTRSQLPIYFRDDGVPKATETRLNDEAWACVDCGGWPRCSSQIILLLEPVPCADILGGRCLSIYLKSSIAYSSTYLTYLFMYLFQCNHADV